MEYDYIFKVLVLGDRGVGKTTLINQLADNGQANNADIKIRTIVIEDKTLKLNIWDPVRQGRFGAMPIQFYREAHGVLIVYDITNQGSFNAVEACLRELNKFGVGNIPKILVGNKADRQDRQVQFEAGEALATRTGMHFYETRALPNLNDEGVPNLNVEGPLTDIATQMKEANDPVNDAHRIVRNRVRINPHVNQNADQGIWGWGCSC